MSNPLIKPNDPRFQNRAPLDQQGKNLFAEPADLAEKVSAADSASGTENVFAASQVADEQPFQPEYLTTQTHRGTLLLVLAILGLTGNAAGTIALSGVLTMALMLPFLAIFPAGAAWLLANEDLRAMRLGAMDASGEGLTRIAMWMGAGGVVCSILGGIALVVGTLMFVTGLE